MSSKSSKVVIRKAMKLLLNKSVELQIRKFELSGKVPANRNLQMSDKNCENAIGLMLSLGLT